MDQLRGIIIQEAFYLHISGGAAYLLKQISI